MHMEPLVVKSLGYDLALPQGITELPRLQGHHDAGLRIMFQQCLWHTSAEVVEATKLLTDRPPLGRILTPLHKLVRSVLSMTEICCRDPRSTLFGLCTSAGPAM